MLSVKFAKAFSNAFELQHPEEQETSALAEHRRISRQFIPFTTSPAPDKTLSGVFLTGENPSWIVQTDKSSVRTIPSGHAVVHAFTATSLWGSKGDFLLYSDEVGQMILYFKRPCLIRLVLLGSDAPRMDARC
jgi:cleavage and polyadenylation specificity factor subunit 1